MKFFKLIFILVLFFMSSLLFAKENPCPKRDKSRDEKLKYHPTTIDYTIEGNTIKTLGFSFRLKQAAEVLKDKDAEFDCYIYRSPDKKMGILSLGSGENREPDRDLWLIDFDHKVTTRLDETGGSFTTIVWHSNEIFEIYWGGQGYEISVLVKVGKTIQKQRIDDLLDIDFKRGVYVALDREPHPGRLDDFLEVGRLFEKDAPKEKFRLPLMGIEYSAYIRDADIKGNRIVVCFDEVDNGNKVDQLVFSPKMLK